MRSCRINAAAPFLFATDFYQPLVIELPNIDNRI